MDGYDLGGAEYPLDAEGEETIIVIDTADEQTFRSYGFTNPYVCADITQKLNSLEPKSLVNASQVLRYMKEEHLKAIIENIDTLLIRGGKVRLFDSLKFLADAVDELLKKGYDLGLFEFVNPAFDEFPSDWKVELTKP